ncbi:MAG: right-handed parallel beta-helix repeat-containing protein [bacterium]
MKSLSTFSIFLLLAAATLSGCATTPQDQNYTVNDACPSNLEGHCHESGVVLVIGGLTVYKPNGTAGPAIRIQSARSVQIRDSKIEGATFGIEVSGGCPSCTLSIDNTTVSAQWVGLQASHYTGNIVVRGSSFSTWGQGNVTRGPLTASDPDGQTVTGPAIFVRDPAYAIEIANSTMGTVAIHDSTLVASRASVGWAMNTHGSQLDTLVLDHMQIAGYRVAYEGRFHSGTAHHVRIQCDESAIIQSQVPFRDQAQAPSSFEAVSLDTSECSQGALRLDDAKTIKLNGFAASGGQATIDVRYGYSMALSNFTLNRAQYGLHVQGDSTGRVSLSLAQGTVANMTYAGVQAKFLNVDVTSVRFTNNGRGWPDPNATTFPGPLTSPVQFYGGLVWQPSPLLAEEATQLTLAVHGSSFSKNVPYAVTAIYASSAADCTGNWWGSGDGPQVYVGPGSAAPSPPVGAGGHGDNVTWNVRFIPFLTSPP